MKFVRCMLTAKVRNCIIVFLCCLSFSSLSFSDNSIDSIKFEDTPLYKAIKESIDKYFSRDSLIENSQYSDENKLSEEAIADLVLYFSTEGSKWYEIFSELDVEESLLDEIKKPLSKKGKRKFLGYGDIPYIIDAMVRLLSVVIKKNTDDDIFDAVSFVRKDFAHVLSGKKNKSKQSENNSDVSIHLIWFSLTGRKTSWGHEIPNTNFLPHQQTIYDWAFYNPDKQVFLWYDSYGLSEEAISQYQGFERTLQSYGLDNVNVLDVKKIDWNGSKINNYNVYGNELQTSTIQSEIDFGDKNNQDLGQKVNFFRINILRNSCSAIKSAMKASAKKPTNCPHQAIYFDLDYKPVQFSGDQVFKNEIGIDAGDGQLISTKVRENGSLTMFGSPISLIAVKGLESNVLGKFFVLGNYGNRNIYQSFARAVYANIFRVNGILGFKNRSFSYSVENPLYHGREPSSQKSEAIESWKKSTTAVNREVNKALDPRGWKQDL